MAPLSPPGRRPVLLEQILGIRHHPGPPGHWPPTCTQEDVPVDGLPPVVGAEPLLAGVGADDADPDLLQGARRTSAPVGRPAPPGHRGQLPDVALLWWRQAHLRFRFAGDDVIEVPTGWICSLKVTGLASRRRAMSFW